jgi:hypothetical protein
MDEVITDMSVFTPKRGGSRGGPGKYDHLLDGRPYKVDRLDYNVVTSRQLANSLRQAAYNKGLTPTAVRINDRYVAFRVTGQEVK